VGRFLLQPGGTHHLALNTIRSQTTFESIRCFVLNFLLNKYPFGTDNFVGWSLAYCKVLISIHGEMWTKARSIHGGSAFTWAIRP
jgi:hypothetical protein